MNEQIMTEKLLKRIKVLEKEVAKLKEEKPITEKFKRKLIKPKLIEEVYDNYVFENKKSPTYILIPSHWSLTIGLGEYTMGKRWSNKEDETYLDDKTKVCYIKGLIDIKCLSEEEDSGWNEFSTSYIVPCRCLGF
jgi:hypothetical protein